MMINSSLSRTALSPMDVTPNDAEENVFRDAIAAAQNAAQRGMRHTDDFEKLADNLLDLAENLADINSVRLEKSGGERRRVPKLSHDVESQIRDIVEMGMKLADFMLTLLKDEKDADYDFFLSFAGEERNVYVSLLRPRFSEWKMFVDEEAMAAGRTADPPKEMLKQVLLSTVVVCVVSSDYIQKKWPVCELLCALARNRRAGSRGMHSNVVIDAMPGISWVSDREACSQRSPSEWIDDIKSLLAVRNLPTMLGYAEKNVEKHMEELENRAVESWKRATDEQNHVVCRGFFWWRGSWAKTIILLVAVVVIVSAVVAVGVTASRRDSADATPHPATSAPPSTSYPTSSPLASGTCPNLTVAVLAGGVAEACIMRLGGGLTTDQLRWAYTSNSDDALVNDNTFDYFLAVPNSDGDDTTHLWSELHSGCQDVEIQISGAHELSRDFECFREALFSGALEGVDPFRPFPHFSSEEKDEVVDYLMENPAAISFFGYHPDCTGQLDNLSVVRIFEDEGSFFVTPSSEGPTELPIPRPTPSPSTPERFPLPTTYPSNRPSSAPHGPCTIDTGIELRRDYDQNVYDCQWESCKVDIRNHWLNFLNNSVDIGTTISVAVRASMDQATGFVGPEIGLGEITEIVSNNEVAQITYRDREWFVNLAADENLVVTACFEGNRPCPWCGRNRDGRCTGYVTGSVTVFSPAVAHCVQE